MIKREITHPIFLKMASEMDDTFWKYIYEDLSYGKCPYGIYLQNEYICSFLKDKEFSYKIDETSQNLLSDIHNLLKNKAGILSEKEKIKKKEEFFTNKINKLNNKKYLRENLIQSFVLKMSEKFDINIEISKKIINFLFVGFMLKVISLKDITFQNDQIENIKGIEFQNKKINIINNFLYDKYFSLDTSIFYEDFQKKNVLSMWNQFANEMFKNNTIIF